MTRLILTTALLLGTTFAAHADNNVWTDMTRQSRSNYQLHTDTDYCDWQVGVDRNGAPTTPGYKACMRTRGWRLAHTTYDPWTWRRHHNHYSWY
jgi:hypothetical protein